MWFYRLERGRWQTTSTAGNQKSEYHTGRMVTAQLSSDKERQGHLELILPGQMPLGIPFSLHAWEGNPAASAAFQTFKYKRDDSPSEWLNIQEHTESPGLNRNKPENWVPVQCFCVQTTWFSHRKESSFYWETLLYNKPMWGSYLVCNQDWNARDEQKGFLWREEQSDVYLVCGCCFPWQPWPGFSVLLEMSQAIYFHLISKYLRQCEKKEIINPDLISGNFIWWVPS